MNTSVDILMDQTTQELAQNLWKGFEPDLTEDRKKRWQEVSREMAEMGAPHVSEESVHCHYADRMQLETFQRVKAALGDKILMKLSEPSRFEVLYVETMITCSAEFKRDTTSDFQKDIDKFGVGAKFDVEKDIQETERELRKSIESKFKLEMLFWSALEKGGLKDASAFLAAIELVRTTASNDLQIEALNWRINLAISLNDFEMFKESFKRAVGMQDQFEDFREAMAKGIRRVVIENLLQGLEMLPSDFGLAQARQSEKDIPAYFEEQAQIFLREAFLEIVDKMCADPELDLIKTARMALSEKRRSYLRVNPCFKDILFVEKKKEK